MGARAHARVCVCLYMCLPTYACLEKPVVASFKPVSNQRVCLAAASLLEGAGRWWCSYSGGAGAGPCSPRRSADASDEVGEKGGERTKGHSVRGKVEETLTRRPTGTGRNGGARVGYFRIPKVEHRGRRRRLWTLRRKKRAKRVVTETSTYRDGKRVMS